MFIKMQAGLPSFDRAIFISYLLSSNSYLHDLKRPLIKKLKDLLPILRGLLGVVQGQHGQGFRRAAGNVGG
ncbi:MAG: hypothetical protein IJS41_02905, partial [Clostridia bacterium]|nr:hypothetical protein [Clostridia bacterium]